MYSKSKYSTEKSYVSATLTANQTPRKFKSIDRPEALRSRTTDAGLPGLRAATQYLLYPLVGHRVATIGSAQEGSGDGGIGVGVTAAHHRVHDPFLQ